MQRISITGADFHDGAKLHKGAVLDVLEDGHVTLCDGTPSARKVTLKGGIILPGFVDLQVNGGDGVMFNEAPTLATLERMARAHKTLGCAAILPTLITDTPAKTRAAIDAAVAAVKAGVSGIVGLHLEGPHLAVSRKGAHDGALIRPMMEEDMQVLLNAAVSLPNLMVTVAPEAVTSAQITALSDAGIVVSLGHSDCSFAQAQEAFASGARCVTHLFNAMSAFGSREPGLVGAALATEHVHTGLIADGIHVHPASMATALAAKQGAVFLVSDAMAPAGSTLTRFQLNGREITRQAGRLTLADGTLAGADLSLARAIAVLVNEVGIDMQRAIAMATSGPARLLSKQDRLGRFTADAAQLNHLDLRTAQCVPLQTLLDL